MRTTFLVFSLATFGLVLLVTAALADVILLSTPGIGTAQLAGMLLGMALLVGCGFWFSRRRGDRSPPPWLEGRAGVAVLCLAFLVVITFTTVVVVGAIAVREKGAHFVYDRTTGPARVQHLLQMYGLSNIGVCRCAPDLHVEIDLPGGFRTTGSVYRGRGEGPRPSVVLIHGNTWLGRRLSTYRLIGRLLADQGFNVLTYDQVGFGEADSRFTFGEEGLRAAYDTQGQAAAVVSFLLNDLADVVPVDDQPIAALGHSGGVDTALRIAHSMDQVARVVIAVAPPPPVEETGGAAARSAYFSRRAEETHSFIYGNPWPDWFMWEMTGVIDSDPLELYLEAGHPPVLMVLGEKDEPRGHPAMLDMLERMAGDKQLAFLPEADHYLNTAQFLGLVVYHRSVARSFVQQVTTWLEASEEDGPKSGALPAAAPLIGAESEARASSRSASPALRASSPHARLTTAPPDRPRFAGQAWDA